MRYSARLIPLDDERPRPAWLNAKKRSMPVMTENSTASLVPETIYVKETRVACDGGGGALGHPLVYYTLVDGEAVCGYCGRKFILDPEKADAS